MKETDIWQWIPAALSAVATIGLFIYAKKQVKIQKAEFINGLDKRFEKHYDIISDIENNNLIDFNDKSHVQKLQLLLDFFESLEYFLGEGLIDIGLIEAFYGYYINISYNFAEVKILIAQSRKEDKEIYTGFEHLVKLLADNDKSKITEKQLQIKLGKYNKIIICRNYKRNKIYHKL